MMAFGTTKFAACVGIAALLAASACGNSTTQTPDPDGGMGSDTGMTDSGPVTDMGPRNDMSIVDMGGATDMTVDGPITVVDMGVDLGIDTRPISMHLREAFCAPVATAICAAGDTCGCDAFGGFDEPTCVINQISNCGESMDEVAYQVGLGSVAIVEASLTACATELSALASLCQSLDISSSPSCALAFSSTVPIGGSCGETAFGVGCASGEGYCDHGICVDVPEAGASCFSACELPSVCRGGECGAPRAVGDACSFVAECVSGSLCIDGACVTPGTSGATCDDTHPCHGGLFCTGGTCMDGLPSCSDSSMCSDGYCEGRGSYECRSPGGVGSPCDGSEACIPGTVCNYLSSLCQAAPAPGEECDSLSDCGTNNYCDWRESTPVCKPLPTVGESCATGGIIIDFEATPAGGRPGRGTPCAEGLICHWTGDGSDPTCQYPPGPGEECTDGVCIPGYVCRYFEDGSPSICSAPPGPGEECFGDGCPDGYYCLWDEFASHSTCSLQRGAGEACSYSGECSTGLTCYYDSSGTGSCITIPGLGESCPTGECTEGAYCAYSLTDGMCRPSFCDLVGGGGGIDEPPSPGTPIPL